MDPSNPFLAPTADDLPPFPPSQPLLQRLDRSVLCQICKEPFRGPVSISCGHSFCSECIRSSLDVQKKCPNCNETAGEGSIRRNRALEEITEAWDAARPTLINLAQPPAAVARKRPPPESIGVAGSSSKPSSSTSLKRQRQASGSRSRSPVKNGDDKQHPEDEVIQIPDSDGVEPEEEAEEEVELSENDTAPCPLCSASLPIVSIPMHIERGCPPPRAEMKPNGTGNQRADWKKVFAGTGGGGAAAAARGKDVEMKRITKPNYSLATPAELRGILSEYNLPTTGDRPTLESRVQEWIILFNANLDTSNPRSLPALRARLAEAEASRRRDKERGKDGLGKQLASEEGMGRYAVERKGEFERLRREILARDKGRRGSGASDASSGAVRSGLGKGAVGHDGDGRRAETPIELD